ncbi:MAG: DUF5989 family protein [Fibrobacteria bacterium]
MKKAGPTKMIDENLVDESSDDFDGNPGLISEFFQFLKQNKKWWLLPLILAMLGIGGLLLLAGKNAALAPFIYTLF